MRASSAISRLLLSSVVSILLTTAVAHGADWPQFNLDARHSGASQQETTIHAGNVATLHKLYSVALPAVVDGAPAFLAEVSTAGGVKDLLFLTTKDGRLLAVDAATGTIVWFKQPATTPRYTTSMPAIDPSRLYVYSYGLEGRVHKYQVGDGTEITTGGWPEVATLKPDVEKSSPGLAIATAANGTQYLYVANGGYPGDAGDYQGHITAINLATGAQKVFNAACSDQTVHFVESGTPDCVGHVQTAIWARSGVVYDSDNDKLFMATGNGDYDGSTLGHEWGDSVFALHPDGTGTGSGGLPIDSYTPVEQATLNSTDQDLGSTAPAVLPTPPGSQFAHLGLQAGKDSKLRLLNLDDLSRSGGPGHVGGEIQKIAVPQGAVVLTAPAVWSDPVDGSTWTFVGNGAGLSAFQVTVDGAGNPSLTLKWSITGTGSSPLLANGILYWESANKMRAIDPRSGNPLWSDTTFGAIHWESPIVIQGRLYATDESSGNPKLWAWAPAAAPLDYYTLTPCRLIDTRTGGPALTGGTKRRFTATGQCGIPSGAQTIVANVTGVVPDGAGDLRIGPSGFAAQTAAITFKANQTLSDIAVIGLTGDPVGDFAVQADLTGTVHLVVDVVGYFK